MTDIEWRDRVAKLLLAVTGTLPRPCRGCGRLIWFVVLQSGKRAPYTDEALNHFADCPEANQFRGGTHGEKKGPDRSRA